MHVYVTCDTESSDTNHEGRLVQCFLKHVGTGTGIRQGANSGGMVGGAVIIFIALCAVAGQWTMP